MSRHLIKISEMATQGAWLWAIFLFVFFILLLPFGPFLIYPGALLWVIIIIISSVFFLLFNRKGQNVSLRVVYVILLVLLYLSMLFSPLRTIKNPFTSQQFAAGFNTNLFGKGTITYYRRAGLFLYSPHESEYGEYSGDSNFVSVSLGLIHVNSTFAGPGEDFEHKNTHINLRRKQIEKFILYKKNFTSTEYIELYGNKMELHAKRKDISHLMTKDTSKQLRSRLEQMGLAESKELDADRYYYQLEIKMSNDDAYYYADVDGQELYEYMYEIIMNGL